MLARTRFAIMLFGVSLGLCACAADKMPAWMSEPPKDDAQSWYGTGEGPDLESARRSALRGVAARLRTTIEGQVSNSTTVKVAGGKEQVVIDARSSVVESLAKTDFTRFEVVQSAKGGIGVFALVKVDKPAFIADTRSQLQTIEAPVRATEAALPGMTTLDKFLALRRLKPQLENGARLSLLLQGAGVDDEGRAGVRRYAGLLQTSSDLGTQLTFELRAPADPDIGTALAAFLAEQGMRTANSKTAGANVLTVSSSGREADLFGSKELRLKVMLAVLDDKGRAAASREYEFSGSSRFDFKGAREDALKKFKEALRKEGPVAGLGFKE